MTHQPAGITRWERSTGQHVSEELSSDKNQSSRPGSLHPQQDHLAAGEEAPASQMHHHQKHHHRNKHNQMSHDGKGIQQRENQNQLQGTSNLASNQKPGQAYKAASGPLKRSQKQHKQQKQDPTEADDEDEDENSEADSDVLDPNLNVYDNVQYN